VDGLPQAAVEIIDDGHWLRCCPLCGCTHQILGADKGEPYIPLCQTQPVLYKTPRETWRKQHPEVVHYTALHLLRAAA
jgi:hypothetical protein